jgi:hypothetical protein
MRESDLHYPLKTWLEGQGYHVSAEVQHCDLVATSPDTPHEADPIILELKTSMSLDLVSQGVRRQEVSENVYLAIPVHGSSGTVRKAAHILPVLRRLGLGLVIVRFLRQGTRVEVVLHPGETTPRRRHRKRQAILREIDGRYAELNRAGQTSREERFSAYRQRAIRVLALLWMFQGDAGVSPAELRGHGAPESVQQILSANHYGWFERVRRGRYRVSTAGDLALERYRQTQPGLIRLS